MEITEYDKTETSWKIDNNSILKDTVDHEPIMSRNAIVIFRATH